MDLEKIKEEARRTALERKYPYRIFFLSKISPYITYVCTRTSVTPNQLTLISFLFTVLGAILLSMPSSLFWIFGWLLLQIYLILDCCDGELARIKDMETSFGAFLDNFLHPISNALVVIGAGLGCYLSYDNPTTLLLTSGASVVTIALSLFRSNILLVVKDLSTPTEGKEGISWLRIFVSPGGVFHPLLILSLAEAIYPTVPFRIIYIPSILLAGTCILVVRLIRFYQGVR